MVLRTAISRAARRAQPGRWRRQLEQQVQQLRAENARLRGRPAAAPRRPQYGSRIGSEPPASFVELLLNVRRSGGPIARADTERVHPRRQLHRKLASYRLAASHGVPVPQIHGVWTSPDDIPWDNLPDRFVLKAERGASGRGVFPLEREGEGFRVLDGSRTYTVDELRTELRTRRGVGGPYFAEAALEATEAGTALPNDIKVYAFYGEVGHVMLRRMPEHSDLAKARLRYLDADGNDLGPVSPRQIDATIPVPRDLPGVIETARRLSRAVPLAFVRVDLYETSRGVVFGELTVSPGGNQDFVPPHDQLLGEMWLAAQVRLELDLARGERPFATVYGPHSQELVGG